MLVTCCVTKEKIDKDKAFAVMQESGRNKYYKSKDLYLNEINKIKFYEDLKEFSGMRYYDKFPVEIMSYFSNLNRDYTWTELYKSLTYKASDIKETRKKEFSSVSNKLLYIAKIVESGLVINQRYENTHQNSWLDVDNYNEIIDLSHKRTHKKRSVLEIWKKGR